MKTTTLHVHDVFLYISLPSLPDYDVKIPNCKFNGGRKQATTNLFFSLETWVRSSRNQLQGNSSTLAIFSRLELTRQRLKKHEFILKVTFSLPSASSMLKLLSILRATTPHTKDIFVGRNSINAFEPGVLVNCANNFITEAFIHQREYTQTWQNSGIESSVKIVCTRYFPFWHGSDTVLAIKLFEKFLGRICYRKWIVLNNSQSSIC